MRIAILILLISFLGHSQLNRSYSDMRVGLGSFLMSEWTDGFTSWYCGELDNDNAYFELRGDTANLESVTLHIVTDTADGLGMLINMAYVMQFVQNALPKWKDSHKWVAGGVEASVTDSSEVAMTFEGRTITIDANSERKTMIIKIEKKIIGSKDI